MIFEAIAQLKRVDCVEAEKGGLCEVEQRIFLGWNLMGRKCCANYVETRRRRVIHPLLLYQVVSILELHLFTVMKKQQDIAEQSPLQKLQKTLI